jgi:hypothetical protein
MTEIPDRKSNQKTDKPMNQNSDHPQHHRLKNQQNNRLMNPRPIPMIGHGYLIQHSVDVVCTHIQFVCCQINGKYYV